MTIVKHEIKMNFKSLLIWSLTVGSLIFVFMMIYPSLANQLVDMEAVYSNMGSFSAAFGMDQISFTTPLGFYGIEAGAMLSLGGAMFAAMIGTSMLCKEEGNHTSEFLFTMPHTRTEIIAFKVISMAIIILAFDAICFVCGVSSFIASGENLEFKKFALYHVAQTFMHLQIGMICFGISAFLKKNNVGLGIGIAILLYFLQMFVNISDKVEFLKYITPYCYSDAAKVFPTSSIDGELLWIGMMTGFIFLGIAFVKYNRKDLAS
ncbi:MAG TPA: ABC transporter permease subunit [Lachnospiraceae bacterium]|nr:ABC transporter permease subunit [Lachnospiraceae bacterium]